MADERGEMMFHKCDAGHYYVTGITGGIHWSPPSVHCPWCKLEAFGPLKAPSAEALKVFEKVAENDQQADMRAIPNQWLLNERGVSQCFSDSIEQLESRLDSATQNHESQLGIMRMQRERILELERRLDKIGTLARAGRETSQFTHARAALDAIIKETAVERGVSNPDYVPTIGPAYIPKS